ncbi:MAG: amidohydrolase family protein [Propionibacteriaceae bacterium]|jgi:imidazolonepropionase-like amidohydrolase|nr:amidohydrolase family protein [Propionibacteriaceae bacterium]
MIESAGGPAQVGSQAAAWHLRGVVLPEARTEDLWIVRGRLTRRPVAGATSLAEAVWILPGLVDAHCHIGLGPDGAVDRATSAGQAIADRDAGSLLLRDAGSPADTRWIDQRSDLPRLIRAGRHIARPRRYLRGYAAEIDPGQLVAEVVRQAGRGDGWVKLVGDWIDRQIGDLAPLWPADLAARAIAAAHAQGARVTAHCFGEQAVAELVAAGVDCVEHGTGLDQATLAEMARRQVALVPTLDNLDIFPGLADQAEAKFPRYAAHMRHLYAGRLQVMRRAVEAGVPIYAGSDAGGSRHHGTLPAEVAALAGLGGADFALGAASWRARAWLGRPGLEEGAPADLVCFAADPRRDPAVLGHPALVLLDGRPVAGPSWSSVRP